MNFTTAHVKLLWPSPKLLHQNIKTKGLLMHTVESMCISEASLHFRRPAPTWSMRIGSHTEQCPRPACVWTSLPTWGELAKHISSKQPEKRFQTSTMQR